MDKKKKRVLFILDLYKPHIWGVEVLFESIISRLVKEGVNVVILTSKYSKELKKYEKIWKNIEIHRSGWNRYIFMLSSIFLWIKLAKNIDIIHTTTYNAAFPSYIIGKIAKKKVVITVHEIFWKLWYKFMWWKWFFFKLYEDFIFILPFEKYICVSNYTKNSIRLAYGISDNKLSTIYNGIDYDKWSKNSYKIGDIDKIKEKYNLNKYFTGIYYGRPWISKWLEYYLMAIPNIIKSIPNFKAFLIVPESDASRIQYIKNIISDLEIEENIIWIGWMDNKELPNYILTCDFVVVPSLAEWFWFSAVEACSLWKKLLVSEISSLPEVVSGKIHFIEPGNSESISKWIINIHQNIYEDISEKIFSWDKNIEKTLDIYERISWKKY